MKWIAIASLCLLTTGCEDKPAKDPSATTAVATPKATSTAPSDKAKPAAPAKAKKAPESKLECATLLTAADIASACGTSLEISDASSIDGGGCVFKIDHEQKNRYNLMVTVHRHRARGPLKSKYGSKAKVRDFGPARKEATAGQWPFKVTATTRKQHGSNHGFKCDDKALATIAELVQSRLPVDPKAPKVNPGCAKLLTPADFNNVCGKELTLEPSFAEGMRGSPCNRSSGYKTNFLMLVTKHASAKVAQAGAKVADVKEQKGLNLYALSGSAGSYAIELKTGMKRAACDKEALPKLMDLALSRVGELDKK